MSAQESIAQTGLTGAQITPWQWQQGGALLYQELVSRRTFAIYLADGCMIMFFLSIQLCDLHSGAVAVPGTTCNVCSKNIQSKERVSEHVHR